MPWFFFTICLVASIPSGFVVFSDGAFFRKKTGRTLQGVMSLICFGLMILAFVHYDWKVGLATVFLIFVGSNIGLSILNRMRGNSG